MYAVTGLIIACLTLGTYGVPRPLIVNGTNATDSEYPYQVSLKHMLYKNHFCGGAIVSKKYVITAAHCLEELNNPHHIFVDVGSTHLYSPETRYIAHELIIHPNYNKELNINDIGLIKLMVEINFSENIKSIDLISYDRDFENLDLIVTGWGLLQTNGSIPECLQKIIVKGFSQKRCSIMYNNFNEHQICTLVKTGGMCNGDSGGALTYKGDLVGIVSYGVLPCASHPDVFTRVYFYREWVNEHINVGSNHQLNIILGLFTTCLCIHSFL